MSETYYPYPTLPTAEEPVLTVSSVLLDGKRPLFDPLAAADSVDLAGSSEWLDASLHVRVRIPASPLAAIAQDPRVVVTLHCDPTNIRVSSVLKQLAPGTWAGDLDIDRSVLARRATLIAVVVGTADELSDRLIGRSNQVAIALEAHERPSPRTPLKFVWTDFPTDPNLEEFRSETHFVDLTMSPPTVFLNRSVEGLPGLLADDPPPHPEARALRTVALASIAVSAWQALMAGAISSVTQPVDSEEVEWPGGWQGQVLRTLLPHVYPDSSLEDALKRVATGAREPVESLYLNSRIQAAVSMHVRNGPRTLEALTLLDRLSKDLVED